MKQDYGFNKKGGAWYGNIIRLGIDELSTKTGI